MQVIEFTSSYSIKTLHTPGHTPESVLYLVLDKKDGDKPLKVSMWVGGRGCGCGTAKHGVKQSIHLLPYNILPPYVINYLCSSIGDLNPIPSLDISLCHV